MPEPMPDTSSRRRRSAAPSGMTVSRPRHRPLKGLLEDHLDQSTAWLAASSIAFQ
jgi:hypothetical protein